MSKADLKNRWTSKQIKEISYDLERGRLPKHAKRLEFEGVSYVDLRGIAISELDAINVMSMDHWDLSYSDLGHGWMRSFKQSAKSCRFIGVALDGNVGYNFADCDFSQAKLNADLRGRFERCLFRETRLKHMPFSSGRSFIACDFTNADLRGSDLNDAVFENCIWDGTKFGGGSANRTKWIGTRPTERQLGDTWIMTQEEMDREREIERQVQEQLRREKQEERKRRR